MRTRDASALPLFRVKPAVDHPELVEMHIEPPFGGGFRQPEGCWTCEDEPDELGLTINTGLGKHPLQMRPRGLVPDAHRIRRLIEPISVRQQPGQFRLGRCEVVELDQLIFTYATTVLRVADDQNRSGMIFFEDVVFRPQRHQNEGSRARHLRTA